jgi:Ca2+-binding RTX toxin-like protein
MIQTDNHTPIGSNEKPYRYVFQAGHGQNTINSKASENHNNQNIEIVFEKAYAADAIFFHSGNDLIIQAFNNQDSVTLTDFLSPDKTNICTFTFIFEDKTLNSKDIADITTTLNDTNKNNEPTDSHSNNSINDKTDDDKPYGENSNNILNEIASYSTLISGTGNDTLSGVNFQKDRYEFETGHGQDVIYDLGHWDNKNTINEIVFKGANFADALFSRSGDDLIINAYGNSDSVTLPDYFSYNNYYSRSFNFIFEDQTLEPLDINNRITFTQNGDDNDNVIVGWQGKDILNGGAGNDTLWGGDGDDILNGGAGNDTLNGGAGYDILIGSTGDDTLKGGDWHKDRYEFEPGHGQDVIYDQGNINYKSYFNDVVFKSANLADAQFTRSGNDLVICAYDENDSVTLPDYFNNSSNRAFNFVFDDKVISTEEIKSNYTFTITGDDGDNVIVGWDGKDILIGGAGNDTLSGGNGDDILNGDEGDDILNGENGNDILNGGTGNDTLNGGAGYDILIGGTGDDTLKGGDWHKDRYEFEPGHGQDVIYDQGNINYKSYFNDVVFKSANLADAQFTRSGNDLVICAYDENDSVTLPDYFNNSSNRAFNFVFDDKVISTEEIKSNYTFTITGDDGDNVIVGWDGKDILIGGAGNDTLSGGNGDDILNGDEGDDILNGENGNDILNGGTGNDTLNGGAGYDILIGGTGNDILKGGDWHKDRYEFEPGHGQDVIYDQGNTNYKSYFNDVVFKGANLADAQFTRSGNDLVICAYNEDDSVTLPDYFNNSSNRAFNFVFDDKVLSVDDIAAMSFILGGTSGDDVLRGWNSHDIIAGGPGNDKLYGGDGIDNLFGGAGNDELYGESGNDYLSGGDGDDFLDGGSGYDVLVGGRGNDILKGGDYEKDRYEFAAGHGQDVIYDQGSAGYQNQCNDIVFKGANFTDALFYRSGNNLIIKAYGNSESVTLSDYFNNSYNRAFNFIFEDQTIEAKDINNKITVTLNGDDNDNKITGHWGNDLINGGKGNDILSGENGDDILNGGDGNDILYGGNGNDVLDGGAGNDNLYGNAGNDTLIGGTGNDYMAGGTGNDTYVFSKGHGQDIIYDYDPSSGTVDTIQFTDVDFADVKFRKNDKDLIIYDYNDNDSVVVSNFFFNNDYTIEKFVFKDKTVTLAELRKDGMQLYGTSGNDTIVITNGRALVYGDDGDDNITTGGSNDVLDGGAGNDNLYGNAGNDTLIGGTGNDYMAGGTGNDTYVFSKGHGQDIIYDYDPSSGTVDTIQFTDVDFADVKFRKNNKDLIIYGYNDNDSVVVSNFFFNNDYTIEKFVFKDKAITLAELRKIIVI